ncbi:MAG: hypothetical protein WCG07_00860 [Candidatus Taylorbacteria bacterium]
MKTHCLVGGLLTAVTPVMIHAQDTLTHMPQFSSSCAMEYMGHTNATIEIFPPEYSYRHIEYTEPEKTLLAKWVGEMNRHPDPFINAFGNPAEYTWATRLQTARYDWNDTYNGAGQHAFESTAGDALREASVSYFPVEQYESWGEHALAWFIHGTIGNTAEAEHKTITAVPDASDVSWYSENQVKRFDGGVRLFDDRPYVYGRARIGSYQGRPFATVAGRWYYDIGRGSDRIELETTLAMPYKFNWKVAMQTDPFHFSDQNGAVVSTYIQHVDGSIFDHMSLGVVQNHETLVVAMANFKW